MPVAPTFTANARRLGMVSAAGTVVLGVTYAGALAAGLASLKSPEDPIGDPWFTVLEILIIVLMPVMLTLMVAVHAWAPAGAKAFSLLALVFMALVTGLTCSLHFVILTLARQPAFAALDGLPMVLSFRWPSVAYAIDILAWDVFFPLAVLCAAPVFGGNRLAGAIRALLVMSGVLAFAGLSGLAQGDMQLRNIGIVGYSGVFPVVAALMGVLFKRTRPSEESS